MAKNKFGKFVALSTVVGAGAWVYKKYDTIKSMYHKVALFNGKRYEYEEFDGEAIAAMFSGIMIDLSDVEFVEDEVYLDIYGLCSGIRILIPSDVEVVLEGTNNASGIQVDQNEDDEKSKTLYINYNLTACGMQVTDQIDDFEDVCCCGDEGCDDEECCGDECTCDEEEVDLSEDKVVDIQEKFGFVKEEAEEALNSVEDVVEDKTETVYDTAEEQVEDIQDTVEEQVEDIQESVEEQVEDIQESIEVQVEDIQEEAIEKVVDIQEEASESVEEVQLDEVVQKAANELNAAAEDVDSAIEDFVKDESLDVFETVDDDDDDFFS